MNPVNPFNVETPLHLEETWQYYFLCSRYYTMVFKIDLTNEMVTMTLYGPKGKMDMISLPDYPGENYYPNIRYYFSAGRLVWNSYCKMGFRRIDNAMEIEHPYAFTEAWEHLKSLMGDRFTADSHPLAKMYITGRSQAIP